MVMRRTATDTAITEFCTCALIAGATAVPNPASRRPLVM